MLQVSFAPCVALFLLGCVTSSRASELRVEAMADLPELSETIAIDVSGRALVTSSLTFQVFEGETDVSGSVSIQQTELDVDDSDSNGIAESLVAKYVVTFTSLDPVAGDELTFKATASTGAETLISRDVTRVVPHVEVTVTDVFPTGSADPQLVLVEVRDVVSIQSATITARFGGNDVTALVSFTGPTILADLPGPGSPPSVDYRSSSTTFDPTALGASAGEVLEIKVTVQTPQGVTAARAVATAMAFSTPTPAVKTAFATLVKGLKLKDGAGGGTCVTATAAEIKAAVDKFQDDVKDEPNPGPIDEPNGEGMDSNGQPKVFHVKDRYSSQGGNDVSFSGSADAVVAIGGDGTSGTTTDGASASATNDKAGGAAVAAAGDGADAGSSGGDGADAKATGNSTSSQNDDGSAVAIGGDGGDPSPDDKKGGNGGGATASVEGADTENPGSNAGSAGTGNPPGAGKHGKGKWARRDKGSAGSGPGANDPKNETNTGG